MSKTVRSIRMDSELSKTLDSICVRHGDMTYHVEQALAAYAPIKKLLANDKPKGAKVSAENAAVQEVLAYLNKATGRQFKSSHDLAARLKEYTIDDCKQVILYKAKEWMGSSMQKYLRPETLFAKGKFAGYLNDSKQGVIYEEDQREELSGLDRQLSDPDYARRNF